MKGWVSSTRGDRDFSESSGERRTEERPDEILMKPLTWLKRCVSRTPQGPDRGTRSHAMFFEMTIVWKKPANQTEKVYLIIKCLIIIQKLNTAAVIVFTLEASCDSTLTKNNIKHETCQLLNSNVFIYLSLFISPDIYIRFM